MARRINPNRMELLKLKKRLRLALRGHKLMKDKFDELLKEFMDMVKEAYQERKELEQELLREYQKAASVIASHESGLPPAFLERLPRSLKLEREFRSQVGVRLVDFKLEFKTEETGMVSPLEWDVNMIEVLESSRRLIERAVRLASLERNIVAIAEEMERTRRRVNALEQILIPQIRQQIKQVTMKLDEMDRETRTRVMKVKEMLEQREAV